MAIYSIACGPFPYPQATLAQKSMRNLKWPIDLMIVLVWVLYAVLFFGTLAKRKVSHIFVANWFFAAFIIVVAMIFIVNNLAMPVLPMKSYSVFAGAQDAIVQWWWGHNAVGFLLTAGVIGMNYYFIPKAADRPIYSYRLSVIHFWGLVGFLHVGRNAPFGLFFRSDLDSKHRHRNVFDPVAPFLGRCV